MAAFIELTEHHHGDPIMVNVDRIETINPRPNKSDGSNGGTTIHFEEGVVKVKESYETVKAAVRSHSAFIPAIQVDLPQWSEGTASSAIEIAVNPVVNPTVTDPTKDPMSLVEIGNSMMKSFIGGSKKGGF